MAVWIAARASIMAWTRPVAINCGAWRNSGHQSRLLANKFTCYEPPFNKREPQSNKPPNNSQSEWSWWAGGRRLGIFLSRWVQNLTWKTVSSVISLIGVPSFCFLMATHRKAHLDDPVHNKLKTGYVKLLSEESHMIERPCVQREIRSLLDSKHSLFGIVLGPTGTGKTFLTRQAIATNKKGIIYLEIESIEFFPQQMAEAIGLKTKHDPLDSFVNAYFSYKTYHKVPKDLREGISYILIELARCSAKYVENHKRMPCLVIDGVDLLAKFNKDIFIALVDLAKRYANEKWFKIILVSSEGHIMPLITQTSSNSRIHKVVEVLEIPDKDAVEYLQHHGVPSEVAQGVVAYSGGHFVFLDRIVTIAEDNERKKLKNEALDNEALLQLIKKKLYIRFVKHSFVAVNHHRTMAHELIRFLFREHSLDPISYLEGVEQNKVPATEACIAELVRANLFRYDCDGVLRWHSKLVENAAKDKWPELLPVK